MTKFFLLALFCTAITTAMAQVPNVLNYQGIARNPAGNAIPFKDIKLRLTIHDATPTGTSVYSETRTVKTNAFGLFTVAIGSAGASPVSGTLATVNWGSAAKYLQVEIDPEGGSNFTNMGTSQLASVPYSLFAASAAPGGPAGGDLSGTYPNPTIGDGKVTAAKLAAGITIPPSGPAGGALSGTYPNPTIADGSITAAKLAPGTIPASIPPGGAAGGDLGGTYPNPSVVRIQSIPVVATAPVNGQVLKFDGTNWTPAADATGGGGGSLTLPYSATENNAATLFSITNNGDGTSIEGVNNTATSSIAAVRGIVNSTAPGGFSAGVRGINNGIGGLGIGVWGSQAGSGWGVYGVTPNGLGVYGNSTGNGYGVFANSTGGTGLNATSSNGIAANISISNNANNNNVLNASSTGNGTVINVSTTGNGVGIFSSTGAGFGVQGVTSEQGSAGIVGDNNGAGEAIVGRTNSDIAGAVVGRNDGGGYGVHGFVPGDNTNKSIGVYGRVGLNNGTGRAARFQNFNENNTKPHTLEVETNSNGETGTPGNGSASYFKVDNTLSVAAAVRADVNSIFGNFGSAAVFAQSKGSGGFAGIFHQELATGNGPALIALADGNGNAIIANAEKGGSGVETSVNGTGEALYAWVPTFGNGLAGRFENFNENNDTCALLVKSVAQADASLFFLNNTQGVKAAVRGKINSIFANFGTAAVYGENIGTGGNGVLAYNSNAANSTPALIARTEGSGNAIAGTSSKGITARFINNNPANGSNVLQVESFSASNLAVFKQGATNVAKIDINGRGFFNGGTQTGGADLAEAFDVEGSAMSYEPGDVLVISLDKERAVAKSTEPYSTLVLGVYATKPGVLLTEHNIDKDLSEMVPMGVIGVIPTKVCLEGGAINKGDLLVTSSTTGVAMKADLEKVKPGQVIGKALANFNGAGIGKINVFVNCK